jgi:hypothetical protein
MCNVPYRFTHSVMSVFDLLCRFNMSSFVKSWCCSISDHNGIMLAAIVNHDWSCFAFLSLTICGVSLSPGFLSSSGLYIVVASTLSQFISLLQLEPVNDCFSIARLPSFHLNFHCDGLPESSLPNTLFFIQSVTSTLNIDRILLSTLLSP